MHWHARETPVRVDDNTVVAAWTFEDDIPGPIVHTRVGDTVEFTLTKDADISHSMVSAGPSHPCNFPVVGAQFDTVYLGAPPTSPIRGVQTWNVPSGGGMCFEIRCDVVGEFPVVNHGFGHRQIGAIGILAVEA